MRGAVRWGEAMGSRREMLLRTVIRILCSTVPYVCLHREDHGQWFRWFLNASCYQSYSIPVPVHRKLVWRCCLLLKILLCITVRNCIKYLWNTGSVSQRQIHGSNCTKGCTQSVSEYTSRVYFKTFPILFRFWSRFEQALCYKVSQNTNCSFTLEVLYLVSFTT